MEKKINISEDGLTVSVSIEVPYIGTGLKKVKYHTSDIRKFLILESLLEGFSIGNCIQNTTVSNTNPTTCKGIWVFQIENTNTNSNSTVALTTIQTGSISIPIMPVSSLKNISSDSISEDIVQSESEIKPIKPPQEEIRKASKIKKNKPTN